MMTKRLCLVLVALALLAPSFAPSLAHAQDGAQQGGNQQGGDVRVTKPPKLVREVQADYPEEAVEARAEGRVVLRLNLDAQGRVTKVEVLEGPGFGLEQAAVAAAEQFLFEPAEINGQPSPVVLTFTINFVLPILPADFVGTVVDPDTGEGIGGARVTIRYTGEEYDPAPEATTVTEEDGTFYFGEVPPGPYAVFLVLDEHRDFETDIDLAGGDVTEVTYKVAAMPENVRGTVLQAGTRGQLAGVEVALVDPDTDEVLRSEFTDGEGGFAFRGVAAGNYYLRIGSPGFLTQAFDVAVTATDVSTGTYYLEAEYYDEYTLHTTARRPRSEVSRQTIRLEEARRMPGAGNDIVRVVQNLPGVARAPYVAGLIAVRGAAPQDTKIFLEGDTIPLVYHFAGGPAIINTEMIEALEFYPGNFSAYYGRATGAVIDMRTRSPRTDRMHGLVEVDLLNAAAVFETPLTENLSLAFSGRRSYFDVFLPYVMPEDGPDVVVAPRYYDYQGWLTYRGLRDSVIELFVYGSDDRLSAILPPGDVQGNQYVQVGGVDLSSTFHRVQSRWEWKPAHLPVENTLMASFGVNSAGFEAAENLFFEADYYQSQIREDLRLKFSDDFALRLGADFLLGNVVFSYSTPRFDAYTDSDFSGNGQGRPNFSPDGFQGSDTAPELMPAFYIEAEWQATPKWKIIPGVRADYFGSVAEASVSPRLSTRYDLTNAVTLKGGVGLFTQPPLPGQAVPLFGNPDITYEKAMHYAAGAEWRPTDFLELDATLYYRDMYDLVATTNAVGIDSQSGQISSQIYNNEGRGRGYGLEFLLRHYPRNRFFGWVGYTLSRAERLNLETDEWDLFQYDQTHILSLVGGYNLPWNFDISARFRYVTGNPYTPVVGGVYDADNDRYVRIHGPRFSKRQDAFHQLDIRLDRRFVFDTWILSVYLDVSNVYWADNAEGTRYNYDYTDSEPVLGLPILPTIGVSGKF